MVNLDLAMDPFMVSEAHAWVWISGWGPKWFGVPASNFLGWFIVSSTILTTHELLTKKAPTIKAQELSIPYACLTLLFNHSTNHNPRNNHENTLKDPRKKARQ